MKDVRSKIEYASVQIADAENAINAYQAQKPIQLIPLPYINQKAGIGISNGDQISMERGDLNDGSASMMVFPLHPLRPNARPYKESVEIPPPELIRHRVASVLKTQREAIDFIAVRLGRRSGSHYDNKAQFPIADTEDNYRRERKRQSKFISESVLLRIDQLRPYAGGDDRFWALHERANLDKHRDMLKVRIQRRDRMQLGNVRSLMMYEPNTLLRDFDEPIYYIEKDYGSEVDNSFSGGWTVQFYIDDKLQGRNEEVLSMLRTQQDFTCEVLNALESE